MSKKEHTRECRPNAGHFRKGHDPRRHRFTREECSAGFWAGLASYVERGGEARNFLRRKMAARGLTYTPAPKGRRGLVETLKRAA